ncbi:MAG: hypothetical protein NTX53_17325 [candidate division WOR-3 bacterium]|nr:hypothetical protein [candidate division WOR-3 bacterium]
MSVLEPAPLAEDASIGLDAQGANHRWRAAVAILALAGAGLVLLSTAKYGAGISPDSVYYLDVARNLVSGKGLVFHTGAPLVSWPPLYPMLLALIGFATGLDPAVFAHLVNAALFALVIYLSARLFRTGFRQNATYSVMGVCAVLLSIPLSELYAMAWSECLFIPFVLLYLVSAQCYWDSGSMLSLAVMILSTALACLTRYSGVALVPAGVLTPMLATGVNFKARFARAFAFAVLSLAPLGLWLLRNHQLTGTFAGPRGPSTSSITNNVILCVEPMLSWYLFGLISELVVLAWIAVLTIRVMSSRTAARRLTSSLKAVLAGHLPAVLFLLTYTIMLLVTSSTVEYDQIGSRLLSPIYVPATLVLLKVGSYLFGPTQRRTTAFVSRVPPVLLALWLCFPLASVARSTARRFKNGAGGCNTRMWRESETVAYARQMLSTKDDVHVYSNGTDALWELARVNASELPLRAEINQGDLYGHWPTESASVLVWFNNRAWRRYFFSIEELEEIADVEEVAHFSDGSIYRVSVRDTAAPY